MSGTLTDPVVSKAIFGRDVEMRDFALYGYAVYVAEDGYYYLKKECGSRVRGKLLALAAQELLVADQWEEAPLYDRVMMEAFFVYLQDAAIFSINVREKNRDTDQLIYRADDASFYQAMQNT
ncbi:MAG: gamma-glutamylcyclotransferase [Clostridiales bacterium]|nr:gamma-glutamylcyclotransferase [Clostridiales bacterium]